MAVRKRIARVEWNAMWKVLGDNWYFDDGPEEEEDALFAEGYADEALFCDAVLMWQGDGSAKPVEPYIKAADGGAVGVLTALKRWRKAQTTVVLVVEYAKADMTEAAATAALKASGFRVV